MSFMLIEPRESDEYAKGGGYHVFGRRKSAEQEWEVSGRGRVTKIIEAEI
jgi:hypothetical protein